MSSFQNYCPRCGTANDPQVERCHLCGQPLYNGENLANKALPEFMQKEEMPGQVMSRRTTLTILGAIGGAILLPMAGAIAYLIQQKINDPHILTYNFNGEVMASSWSPDGKRVASVGWVEHPGTQAVKVWNPLTGNTLLTGGTNNEVVSGLAPLDVVWSANGQQLIAFIGHVNNMIVDSGNRVVEMIQVWNAQTGQRMRSFPVTQPIISQDSGENLYSQTAYCWSLCGQYFAAIKWQEINPHDSSGAYSFLEVWDIATGSIIFTQNMQTADKSMPISITTMKWAPDHGRLAILIDDDKYYRLEIWDIPTKQKVRTFILTSAALHVAPQEIEIVWSPDGKSIAIGPDVYDVETGRKVITYHIIKQNIEDVIGWFPDAKQVLVSSYHYWGHGTGFSTLFVLDASNGRVKAKYDDLGWGLISPNGAYLLDPNEPSGTVDVWKIEQS